MQLVEQATGQQFIGYFDPSKNLFLIIFATRFIPTGLLWQNVQPLMWVHLSATHRKILPTYPSLVFQAITLGLKTAIRYFGRDPETIISPYSQEQLAWLKKRDDEWTVLLSSYQEKFDTHLPGDKLIQCLHNTPFVFPKAT